MGYTTFQSNMLGIPSAILQIISKLFAWTIRRTIDSLCLPPHSHALAQLFVGLLQGKDVVRRVHHTLTITLR